MPGKLVQDDRTEEELARSKGELSSSEDGGAIEQASAVDMREAVAGSGPVRPGECTFSDLSSLQLMGLLDLVAWGARTSGRPAAVAGPSYASREVEPVSVASRATGELQGLLSGLRSLVQRFDRGSQSDAGPVSAWVPHRTWGWASRCGGPYQGKYAPAGGSQSLWGCWGNQSLRGCRGLHLPCWQRRRM